MKLLKAMMVGAAMIVAGTAMADDYNRVSISWDNTYYTEPMEESTNGFGLNYIHGFSLSSNLPMFIELGGSLGFNFYGDTDWKGSIYKERFQNFNVKVPVNFTWKFHIWDDFYISPLAGINFQVNYIERQRDGSNGVWRDWHNLLDKENGWNVFQMGWQAGVNLQYKQFLLGYQIGTSFIPAYHESLGGWNNINIHNTAMKLSLGYEF